jgi:hypothetical protein
VAVIVVAALVVTAAQAVRLPIREKGALAEQADESKLGRTPGGRVTCAPGVEKELSPWPYFLGALVFVIGGSFLASALSDNKWVLGYVIYGLIAFFGIIVPSVLAYGPTPDAPFAGLFRTIADLEGRMHVVGLILLAGLVVLLIHLAFYPWPDVFRHTPGIDSP